MDKIRSAIDITLSEYPWMGKDELVRLFTDYIETHLKDIVARVELPSEMESKLEWFLEKRKPKKFRMSDEKFRERENFRKWLDRVKSKGPIDSTDSPIETDGEGRDDVTRLKEYPFASSGIEIGKIHSKDILSQELFN